MVEDGSGEGKLLASQRIWPGLSRHVRSACCFPFDCASPLSPNCAGGSCCFRHECICDHLLHLGTLVATRELGRLGCDPCFSSVCYSTNYQLPRDIVRTGLFCPHVSHTQQVTFVHPTFALNGTCWRLFHLTRLRIGRAISIGTSFDPMGTG